MSLLFDELCEANSDSEIRHTLDNLPEDLSSLFAKILRRCQLLRGGHELQRRLLKLVVAPNLTAQQVLVALSVEIGSTAWSADRALHDISAPLSLCGSLAMLDEEDLTVRFVHESVKLFILNEEYPDHPCPVSQTDAHTEMGFILLTYLNFGVIKDMDRRISNNVVPEVPVSHIPTRIIEQSLSRLSSTQFVKSATTKALRLLKSGSSQHDMSSFISAHIGRHEEQTALNFDELQPLLDYAQKQCLRHTKMISPNIALEPVIANSWAALETHWLVGGFVIHERLPKDWLESDLRCSIKWVAWAICESQTALLRHFLRSRSTTSIRLTGLVLLALPYLLHAKGSDFVSSLTRDMRELVQSFDHLLKSSSPSFMTFSWLRLADFKSLSYDWYSLIDHEAVKAELLSVSGASRSVRERYKALRLCFFYVSTSQVDLHTMMPRHEMKKDIFQPFDRPLPLRTWDIWFWTNVSASLTKKFARYWFNRSHVDVFADVDPEWSDNFLVSTIFQKRFEV